MGVAVVADGVLAEAAAMYRIVKLGGFQARRGARLQPVAFGRAGEAFADADARDFPRLTCGERAA